MKSNIVHGICCRSFYIQNKMEYSILTGRKLLSKKLASKLTIQSHAANFANKKLRRSPPHLKNAQKRQHR